MFPVVLPAGRLARHRSLFISSLLLALSITTAAHAASLGGTVTDPDGRAVARAEVLVSGPLGVRVVISDADGRYEAADLAAGTYRVLVSIDGFRADPAVVALAQDEARELPLALHLSAVTESVVVSAAHVETPASIAGGSVTVLDAATLRARQIDSLSDALRLVPGLTVTSSGGRGAITSLFPRGGESDYTLVLVDGVRANAFGGGFDLSQAPIGGVERIEVARGPQSALFGADAIGGVVQIVTAADGPPRGEAGFEAGGEALRRAVAHAGGRTGRWSWSGTADRETSDGFTGIAPASGERVTNDDFWSRQFGGVVGFTPAATSLVRATVRRHESDRGYPGPFGSNPIGAFPGVDDVSRGRYDDWFGGATATHPWGPLLSGRLQQRWSASVGDLESGYDSPFGFSTFTTKRRSLRTQTDLAIRPSTAASAGVEIQNERARSTFITGEAGSSVPIERRTIGSFVEVRQDLTPRAAVTAGVRVEQIHRDAVEADPFAFTPRPAFPEDARASVNPRMAASWTVWRNAAGSSDTRLYGSFGTGIRPPDAYEIAYTDNPHLKPERSRSVDVGVQHTFGGVAADVQMTAFRNDYDDLIVAVGPAFADSSHYRTDNISNARAQGVEVGGGWRIGGLALRASYTFLDTTILAVDRASSAPPPFSVGDALIRRPRHQARADVTWTLDRVQAFASIGARGRSLDIEPNYGAFGGLFDLPGYTRVDAGLRVRVHRFVDVFVRASNLLDRSYEESLGFPAPGRLAVVGARVAVGR